MSFKGKSILITGGSRGLGLELGKQLAAMGARVVLLARHAESLDEAVLKVGAFGEAYGVVGDVGDKESIHPIAAQAAALAGPIDVLIHNASALGPTPLRPLLDTECEDLEAVLSVGLVGPFRLTKVVVGGMVLRGGGTVVHISSDAAVEPYARWGAYSVAKAGLDHLGRVWAQELASDQVRFLIVDPGEMNTQMHAQAVPEADPNTLADPSLAASAIVDMLAHFDDLKSGARLSVSNWKVKS